MSLAIARPRSPRHRQRLTDFAICPYCQCKFHPWRNVRPQQRPPCCTILCAQRFRAKERKGKPIAHQERMRSRTLEQARKRLQAAVRLKFGALTPREAEIFNYGYVRGRILTLSRRVNTYRHVKDLNEGAA